MGDRSRLCISALRLAGIAVAHCTIRLRAERDLTSRFDAVALATIALASIPIERPLASCRGIIELHGAMHRTRAANHCRQCRFTTAITGSACGSQSLA